MAGGCGGCSQARPPSQFGTSRPTLMQREAVVYEVHSVDGSEIVEFDLEAEAVEAASMSGGQLRRRTKTWTVPAGYEVRLDGVALAPPFAQVIAATTFQRGHKHSEIHLVEMPAVQPAEAAV